MGRTESQAWRRGDQRIREPGIWLARQGDQPEQVTARRLSEKLENGSEDSSVLDECLRIVSKALLGQEVKTGEAFAINSERDPGIYKKLLWK